MAYSFVADCELVQETLASWEDVEGQLHLLLFIYITDFEGFLHDNPITDDPVQQRERHLHIERRHPGAPHLLVVYAVELIRHIDIAMALLVNPILLHAHLCLVVLV